MSANKSKIFGFAGGSCMVAALLSLFGVVYYSGTGSPLIPLLGCLAAILFGVGLVLIALGEREKKKSARAAVAATHLTVQNTIEQHAHDSAINEIIAAYQRRELPELQAALSKTLYHVDAGYDEEEDSFYLLFTWFDAQGIRAKLLDSIQLAKTPTEQVLLRNNVSTDLTGLTREEILARLIDALLAEVPAEQGEAVDFQIKSPKGILWMCVGGCVLSLLAILVMSVLLALSVMPIETVALLVIPGIILVLCGFGIWVFFREGFCLRDGIYSFRGIFRSGSCRAADVDKVYIDAQGHATFHVLFVDRNGEVMMRFLDDGACFRSGELLRSLNHFGITFEDHPE